MTDNGTTSPSTESGVVLQHGGAVYTIIIDGMHLFFLVQIVLMYSLISGDEPG